MTDKQPEALQDPQMQMWLGYCAMKEEVARLHEVNAELVDALKQAKSFVFMKASKPDDFELHNRIQAALAKAQGDNNG